MKKLIPLISLAVIANILSSPLWFYLHATTINDNNKAVGFLFLMALPALWFITVIVALILSVVKRKDIFTKKIWMWTVLTLLFCTPIPIMALSFLFIQPKADFNSPIYTYKNGVAYKNHTARYDNDKIYVVETFTADSAAASITEADSAYKPCGTWVYFKPNGDTLKVEHYGNPKIKK
jgi:hypothetical protein